MLFSDLLLKLYCKNFRVKTLDGSLIYTGGFIDTMPCGILTLLSKEVKAITPIIIEDENGESTPSVDIVIFATKQEVEKIIDVH